MSWLRSIAAEVLGLFVDDGAFAIAIVLWLALLWWLLPRTAIDGLWKAAILVAGLAVILVDSVLRRARTQG